MKRLLGAAALLGLSAVPISSASAATFLWQHDSFETARWLETSDRAARPSAASGWSTGLLAMPAPGAGDAFASTGPDSTRGLASAVAEPGSWSMLGAGFALIGFRMQWRRARRTSFAQAV